MNLLVFLLTSLVGGAGSPLIKFTLNYFPTITFVALRAALSALIILPFVYNGLFKIETKQIRYLILASALFAGNWLFFAMGIQRTSIIMGQIIYLPTSLIVAAIAYIFLKEKLKYEQVIGLVITIGGFLILTYGLITSGDVLSFGTPLGNLFVVAGLLSWSFYTVISRKISGIYKPQVITFFNFVITSLFAFLLIPSELSSHPQIFSQITPSAILSMSSVVIFSSILFFFFYQWLIKYTSAFISSLVLYPVTILAGLSGVVFFNEKLSPSYIFGGILVFVGVFLATSYQYIKTNFKHAD
jgi:drug/metabolite transporter (DMT)-like permease